MINGLDLFSGIGGLTVALAPWVRPVAYCESDRYARAVLLSRMASGNICPAPIWDDVRTLNGPMLPSVDIVYGGFPCQDISVAGNGAGLEGQRSGLVLEIFRLVEEIWPTFVFMENVPAIRTRGAERVGKELAALGYDCRWGVISAFDVGAPHKRDRWFLLANFGRERRQQKPGGSYGDEVSHERWSQKEADKPASRSERDRTGDLADADSIRELQPGRIISTQRGWSCDSGWWETEPELGRMAHGIPNRVDRLRGLGNAVVPAQAREAFKRLIGSNGR